MKSVKMLALFGSMSLMFMGCPYESKVPVDDLSNAKVDSDCKGDYDEKGSTDYTYKVTHEGNMYKIVKKKTTGEDEPTIYYGFTSKVDDQMYMNVYEDGDASTRKYYIYKFEKKGEDRVKLKGVTDNITEEFASSAELKAYIKKYSEISFFFDKDEEKVFYKN
ncbi:MAG: hypothetical protein ACRCYO_13750 [Bacteroidia bacterium]